MCVFESASPATNGTPRPPAPVNGANVPAPPVVAAAARQPVLIVPRR